MPTPQNANANFPQAARPVKFNAPPLPHVRHTLHKRYRKPRDEGRLPPGTMNSGEAAEYAAVSERIVEFNRNHYFMAGLVVLFLGIQLRFVESFVVNENVSKYVAQQTGQQTQVGARTTSLFPAAGPAPRRTVRPPTWLGYALMSVGSVLILHSLAMNKPGGG